MMPGRPSLRFVLGVALLVIAACRAETPAPPKLVLLGWDGIPAHVVDRLLESGELPALARLASEGARADYVTPGYPSITAQGWSALLTGAYGNVTGATGNEAPVLPRSEHTLFESRSGFAAWSPEYEGLWMPALRAGRQVAVLSASGFGSRDQYLPLLDQEGIPEDHLFAIDVFDGVIASNQTFSAGDLTPASGWTVAETTDLDGALELPLPVGDRTFYLLAYHDSSLAAPGLNTTLLCPDVKDESATGCHGLLPSDARDDLDAWSPSFEVTRDDLVGRVHFRLFELGPDGSSMVLFQRRAHGIPDPSPEELAYLEATGGIAEDQLQASYYTGGLGPPAQDQAIAERRLVELWRFTSELNRRALSFALDQMRPDVLLHYTAIGDIAGHAWTGVLDPQSPKYDTEMAEVMWPLYVDVMQMQDAVLADVLERADPSTVVAVVSDHGMSGTGHGFDANGVLEAAGLLVRDSTGAIDPTRTRMARVHGGGHFLNVNSVDWLDGIVELDDVPGVVAEAATALLAYTHPATGIQPVTAVYGPDDLEGLGMGGPAGGDLYVDLVDGFYPYSPGTAIERLLAGRFGLGGHGFNPLRPEMRTIWFLGGGPVPRGVVFPPVAQIDVAPTLAEIIGIDPPRDATGTTVDQLLRSEVQDGR